MPSKEKGQIDLTVNAKFKAFKGRIEELNLTSYSNKQIERIFFLLSEKSMDRVDLEQAMEISKNDVIDYLLILTNKEIIERESRDSSHYQLKK